MTIDERNRIIGATLKQSLTCLVNAALDAGSPKETLMAVGKRVWPTGAGVQYGEIGIRNVCLNGYGVSDSILEQIVAGLNTEAARLDIPLTSVANIQNGIPLGAETEGSSPERTLPSQSDIATTLASIAEAPAMLDEPAKAPHIQQSNHGAAIVCHRDRLDLARLQMKLSQSQVCALVGLKYGAYWHWQNGRPVPVIVINHLGISQEKAHLPLDKKQQTELGQLREAEQRHRLHPRIASKVVSTPATTVEAATADEVPAAPNVETPLAAAIAAPAAPLAAETAEEEIPVTALTTADLRFQKQSRPAEPNLAQKAAWLDLLTTRLSPTAAAHALALREIIARLEDTTREDLVNFLLQGEAIDGI